MKLLDGNVVEWVVFFPFDEWLGKAVCLTLEFKISTCLVLGRLGFNQEGRLLEHVEICRCRSAYTRLVLRDTLVFAVVDKRSVPDQKSAVVERVVTAGQLWVMNMVMMRLRRKWETILLPPDERLGGATRRLAFHTDRTARVDLATLGALPEIVL